MPRFLKKLLLFSAIQAAILVVLIQLYPGQENTFFRAILDKHRAAALAGAGKILLVGGSGVAFSADSDLLEGVLGRPVVNLGLHVGLGLDFMLNEAASLAQPGDCVVLVLEYEHFTRDMTGTALYRLVEQVPGSLRDTSLAQRKRLLDSGLVWLRKVLLKALHGRSRKRPGVYARESFNAHGDVWAHRLLPSIYEGRRERPLAIQNGRLELACRTLRAFRQASEARSVRVYLTWAPLSRRAHERDRVVIRQVDMGVRRWSGIRRLCSPEELVFPDTSFYDARYHALKAAGQQFSRLLAERLLPLLH